MTTHPSRTHRSTRAVIAGLLVLATLAGCGEDEPSADDPGPAPTAAPDTEAVAATEEPTGETTTTSIAVPDGPLPTVVLVHGAFADASGWTGVADRLIDLGFPVVAPANPLRGLASDAAYLRTFLDTIDGPIVLVGHSYGGMVMTNAARDDADVTALVYAAAFAPDEGDTVGGILAETPGSQLVGDALVLRPYPKADGTESSEGYVAPEAFHDVFAGDLPADDAELFALTQRPGASETLTEPSGPPAWADIPAFYLVATDDNLIPPAAQEQMAERAGAEVVEVAASHLVIVSQPDAVVELIVDAASA